jgi:septal ring factor EnvC (AmiA/AmiB activator)
LQRAGNPSILLAEMKSRIGLVILILLSVGLVIALISSHQEALKVQRESNDRILSLSNEWVTASGQLEEQKQVTTMLEKDLETQKRAFLELTNDYAQAATDLTKSADSLKAAQAEIAKRDARINQLEAQNQELDKKAVDLTSSLTNLTAQIAETERKLASAEGDKAYLEKELKRMMGEKTDLERQFSDLTILRAQVSKLKEDMIIARRTEWIRQGIAAGSQEKGSRKLLQGASVAPRPGPRQNYDLNVEVSADGSVRVVPPTNSAAGGAGR